MSNEYMNVEESLKRLGGKKALYVKLLNHFFKDKSYENLLASVEAGDMAKGELNAHSIKGLAANLSLPLLREVAARVEASFKAGNIDHDAMAELAVAMDKTVEAIKSYINEG